MKILIVKTSSVGDIIQAFIVLDYLHSRFKNIEIDWVVEKANLPLVNSHPQVNNAICFDMKSWKKKPFKKRVRKSFFSFIKFLRKKQYDVVFDLQGNCKSGLVTFFSLANKKVGFGSKSVREWPNLLVTNKHIEVNTNINMRLQYLDIVKKYFLDEKPYEIKGCRLNISAVQKDILDKILTHKNLQTKTKIMVCPGAKWPNKQLSYESLLSFLKKVQKRLNASFLLIWGNDLEKFVANKLNLEFSSSSVIVDKLFFPVWQNLMNDVDLVFAMDSSSLHLCGTIETYSFSVFGPTRQEVFKPIGKKHFAYQGKCPYNYRFDKQCPILRSCTTGACIRSLESEDIFSAFIGWWEKKGTKILASKCNFQYL
ncbi:MAG: Lipopolysaccharide heptosyltransferase 1 [Candidatus Anoxychlamydiales bacterium]|nr:Lipopolysaccharide heptosyltransferase 1 [Candidatus Anoxychlamydiales bacterium]NGX36195.1 Lipopolysaccharide heptosyltransferase 1 [Candidatus Anoxychlamydiales bacterium]